MTGVFVGDEHTLIRSVSGTLPTPLEGHLLLTVPRVMERIHRAHARLRRATLDPGGQISSRLRLLTPQALEAILAPEPDAFRLLTEEELRRDIAAVRAEATGKGIPLTPIGAELVAAARMFDAAIWLGHDRNLPRWALDGPGLRGVDWRCLSDLVEPERPRRRSVPDPRRELWY